MNTQNRAKVLGAWGSVTLNPEKTLIFKPVKSKHFKCATMGSETGKKLAKILLKSEFQIAASGNRGKGEVIARYVFKVCLENTLFIQVYAHQAAAIYNG